MLLFEVVGSAGAVVPSQNGATAVNVGIVDGLITIVREAVVAHCPVVGVKVYTVVAVLSMAGLHDPVIPSLDEVGRAGMVSPTQYGPTAAKVGVTGVLIVMVIEAVVAHAPAVGLNV